MMNNICCFFLMLVSLLYGVSGYCQSTIAQAELEDAFLEKPKIARVEDKKEPPFTKPDRPEALKPDRPEAKNGVEPPSGLDISGGPVKHGLFPGAIVKSKGVRAVNIHFNGVPLNDALLSLARQAGVSITIDREIDVSKVKVTAYYEGESFEEAIQTVISGLDYAFRKTGEGAYAVTPYEEAIFNVHDVAIKQKDSMTSTSSSSASTSGGTTSGSISSGSSATSSGNSGTMGSGQPASGASSTQKTDEREITRILQSVRRMLSSKGIATPMTSGFIYVRDVPSRVKMVKEMLDTDVKKRKTITMKINLIRIDYTNENSTGVNWSAVLNSAKGPSFSMDVNFIQGLSTSGNISTVVASDTNFSGLIKMLGTYGDVHVVHSWESKAVSGAVLPFEMTQTIWYSTGTTVQVVNQQTITSYSVAPIDIGLKMTVNPVKLEKEYLVNTSIDLSSLLAYQYIGDKELPQIERNYVSIPIKMSVGEMVAISGFKIKSEDKKRIGVPVLSKLPILGYLFGYTSSKDNTSELTVLINFVEEKMDRI